jgi:hypothetical protein
MIFSQKIAFMLVAVVHAYKPSYLGARKSGGSQFETSPSKKFNQLKS